MSTDTKKNNNNAPEEERNFSLGDLWKLCRYHWYWFLISCVITCGLGTIYIITKAPTYKRSASVILKEDEGSSFGSSGLSSLGDFGMFSQASMINNELLAFSSPDLYERMIRRLGLETSYSKKGTFHRVLLYGDSLPVKVSVFGQPELNSVALKVRLDGGGKYTAYDFKLKGKKVAKGEEVHGTIGKVVHSPIGNLEVLAGPAYDPSEEVEISVKRVYPKDLAYRYVKKIKISQANDKANVINIEYESESPQLAEDLITTVIDVYNELWVDDKNQIARNTSKFIDERLNVIVQELGDVDTEISHYKSENLVPDLETASNMYMQQAQKANTAIMELNTQVQMAKYVKEYLRNGSNKFHTLPVNSGFENAALAQQINNYNTQIIERNTLAANSSLNNPLVRDMDDALVDMRKAIETSIDNQIVSLNSQIKGQEQYENQAINHIASNPQQAKYLLSVERQQKVKEQLYLYLLQKREETELSKSYTAFNTRVIVNAGGLRIPSSPRKKMVLAICLFFGLAIPVGILFLRENLKTTIRSRKDLEDLSAPLIGEIPLSVGDRKALKVSRKVIRMAKMGRKANVDERNIVVAAGKRDIVNEAFRVLRTNLDFMLRKQDDHNVIAVTSFNPGSGKSFVTMNLAVAFGIKDKKVLVIDGDLRHGSTSQYVGSPKKGLSNYLVGEITNPREIIYPLSGFENIDIIPLGVVPPNPTELLEDGRLKEIINDLRGDYDLIFIDCPPVDIVADTQIIEQHADRTIFVVRVGLLDRDFVKELESFYKTKKYKNISVVLNGSSTTGGKYGYKYGYYASDKE